MVVPFVMAGVLMALAFGAHIFVGTRETLSLRPVAHPANTENMVRVPANPGTGRRPCARFSW